MLSVVVLTRNEEENIKDCICSLEWVDEIIIIDDNSTDKTVEIAEGLNAKVFVHSLDGDFSKQRTFGLEKALGEWVMFIDADEKVSPHLAKEIIQATTDPLNTFDGYFIKRHDVMWGKELKYGETGHMKLLRLVRRASGSWVGKVHERWQTNGKIGELNNPVLHFPHKTIGKFLGEINFYTDIRAKELYDKGEQSSWFTIILYPSGKFIVNYFLKLGMLDGIPGLVFATIMSFHSFLVRGKLWLLREKVRWI